MKLFLLILLILFLNLKNLYSQDNIIIDPNIDMDNINIEDLNNNEFNSENTNISVELIEENLNYKPSALQFYKGIENSKIFNEKELLQIKNYINKFGVFLSKDELIRLNIFDFNTSLKLNEYIKNFNNNFNLNGFGKFKFSGKIGTNFSTTLFQDNYKTKEYSKYAGDPIYLLQNLKFNIGNKIKFGFILQKDYGENFKENILSLFDFQGLYLFGKNLFIFEKIVIGDFQLQIGQGLTMWNGISASTFNKIYSFRKTPSNISPHTSSQEANFYRGTGFSIPITKNFKLIYAISYKKIDATISYLDNNKIASSILISGLHRTNSEETNKNSMDEFLTGGSLQFDFLNFNKNFELHLGLNTFYQNYEYPYIPNLNLYNMYYFRGKELLNYSLDFNIEFKNISLFGETALSNNFSKGILLGLYIGLTNNIFATLLYRIYDKDFHSINGNAYRINSKTINEEGLNIGLIYNVVKRLEVNLNFDYFYNALPTYKTNYPSDGWLSALSLKYSSSQFGIHSIRFEVKKIPQDLNDVKKSSLSHYYKSLVSYTVNLSITKDFKFKSSFSGTYYIFNLQELFGFMAYIDLNYNFNKIKSNLNFRSYYFDNQDYIVSSFISEGDLPGSLKFINLNNSGFRFLINARTKLFKKIAIGFKYTFTQYLKTIYNKLDDKSNFIDELRAHISYSF